MPNSYTALPAPEPEPSYFPTNWNPLWPWDSWGANPEPPGYKAPRPQSFGVDPPPPGDPPPSTYRVEGTIEMTGTHHWVDVHVHEYPSPVTSPFADYDGNYFVTRNYIRVQGNYSSIDTFQWRAPTSGLDMYPAEPGQVDWVFDDIGEKIVLGIDPIRVNKTFLFYLEAWAPVQSTPTAAVDTTFRVYIYEKGWEWQEIGRSWVPTAEVLAGVISRQLTEDVGDYDPRGWFALNIKVTSATGEKTYPSHTLIVTEQWQGSDLTNPYLV